MHLMKRPGQLGGDPTRSLLPLSISVVCHTTVVAYSCWIMMFLCRPSMRRPACSCGKSILEASTQTTETYIASHLLLRQLRGQYISAETGSEQKCLRFPNRTEL